MSWLHRASVNRAHQLTLRTFHIGGTASNITTESSLVARYGGIASIEEVRTVSRKDPEKGKIDVVIGRLGELRIIDKKTGIALTTHSIPYGSKLYIKPNQEIAKGDLICEWDPFNAVIISEVAGKVAFDYFIEGVTFREEFYQHNYPRSYQSRDNQEPCN